MEDRVRALLIALPASPADIGIAEELAQDALVAALERWPEEGIPEKPAAWLMTAAKRRAIDSLRRGRMLEQRHGEIARELEFQQQRLGEAMDQALDSTFERMSGRVKQAACSATTRKLPMKVAQRMPHRIIENILPGKRHAWG